ncbi:hypothetical protein [Chryseobacterium defluvii]|uniref:Uncharacterized protein n=1 Tax=Chryseobacterium defluvii TaxID=160396 RepID=A0A495SCE0_9FLAO|nr:hypothetical protein [Chryseobacterium defluvii]RKS97847.1 hypothetical protein BCF58_1980 [Chryseobacterium defluvii]
MLKKFKNTKGDGIFRVFGHGNSRLIFNGGGGGYSIHNNTLWWWTNPSAAYQFGSANMLKLQSPDLGSSYLDGFIGGAKSTWNYKK